jgi:hypothetical protein
VNAVSWVRQGKTQLELANVSGAMMIQATVPGLVCYSPTGPGRRRPLVRRRHHGNHQLPIRNGRVLLAGDATAPRIKMADNSQPRSATAPPTRLESLLDQGGSPPVLDRHVDLDDWAGGIPQEKAGVPAIRIGRRWFSTWWLVPIGVAGLIIAILLARQLREYGWIQSFLETYPGTSTTYAPPVTSGFPAWLRWQHLFNIVFIMFIIRAGLQILADHPRLYLNSGCRPGTAWFRMRDPVPPDRMDQEDAAHVWTAKDDAVALPKWLGIPGVRHTIGLARWWHFSRTARSCRSGFVTSTSGRGGMASGASTNV